MKNKIRHQLFFFFIIFNLLFSYSVNSEEFEFNTLDIKISNNGNLYQAGKGNVVFKKQNILVDGYSFIYDKISNLLMVNNSITRLKDFDVEIYADKLKYFEDRFQFVAKGNVKIIHLKKNSIFETDEITFLSNEKDIFSNNKSNYRDFEGNNISASSFKYNLETKIIKMNKANYKSISNEKIYLEKAFLNMDTNELIGKDSYLTLSGNDDSGDNFRLKSNSIKSDKNISILDKAVFTTCKKNDDCPPWQLQAEEITHNKKKKVINYKNAWLKIYNQPVLYFPKFFHPDPTVDRQSGFLMPKIINSNNLGNSFEIPYYNVFNDSTDITITPRIFDENKLLTQSEFRKIGKDYTHISDFSILTEKNHERKSHFFSKNSKIVDVDFFDESQIDLNIEYISNDTFLKSYKLESPIINSTDFAQNSLTFNGYNEQEEISFEATVSVTENLSLNNNDKYDYTIPSYNFNKKILNPFDKKGVIDFNSTGSVRYYETNINENTIINDINFNSNKYFFDSGLANTLNLYIKNVNINSNNSKQFKDDDVYLNSLIQLNSSYPLYKNSEKYKSTLEPKISIMHNPLDSKNKRNETRNLKYNNIFSANRLGFSDTLEGGTSFTYGTEYSLNNEEREIISAGIANVFRFSEEQNIPTSSSLNKKTSDIISNINFNPSKNFNLNHEYSLDENLNDMKYQEIESRISINNFITSFEFLNDNSGINNESYLTNTTSYNFDDSNKVSFKTRENKKEKLVEYYNLIYEYANDCLVAAIEFSKENYNYLNLKPEKNLFFKLTIIPFGTTSSPSIYSN